MDKFELGQRVRITVDALSMWPEGWGAPRGTGGVVASAPLTNLGFLSGYGILLDGDPSGLPAEFDADELEAEVAES